MFARRTALLLALAVLAAGCGDDDTATSGATTAAPTTTAAPSTTAAPPTTEAPTTTAATAPESPIQAVIDTGYKFGNQSGNATDDDLPFALGSITAHVFSAAGFYVIVYDGLDLDQTGPVCPGNSLATLAGFEFVSNSPTPGAGCEGAPNVVDDAVMLCDGQVSYLTQIPSDSLGTLFASVEVYPGDGNNVGASGRDDVAGNAPEIDLATLTC